jgi:hypothetical protein
MERDGGKRRERLEGAEVEDYYCGKSELERRGRYLARLIEKNAGTL